MSNKEPTTPVDDVRTAVAEGYNYHYEPSMQPHATDIDFDCADSIIEWLGIRGFKVVRVDGAPK